MSEVNLGFVPHQWQQRMGAVMREDELRGLHVAEFLVHRIVRHRLAGRGRVEVYQAQHVRTHDPVQPLSLAHRTLTARRADVTLRREAHRLRRLSTERHLAPRIRTSVRPSGNARMANRYPATRLATATASDVYRVVGLPKASASSVWISNCTVAAPELVHVVRTPANSSCNMPLPRSKGTAVFALPSTRFPAAASATHDVGQSPTPRSPARRALTHLTAFAPHATA